MGRLLSKLFKRKKNKHVESTVPAVVPTRTSESTIDDSLPPKTSQTTASYNPKENDDGDDNSTFAAPSPSGVMEWNMLAGYDSQSVYGGSVSSEGLTLGNQSFATSAFLSIADGGRSRCDTDDASFFDQSSANLNMEVMHVFAPPGKLGIALDTPDNSGAPIVHYVKEVSPIHGKVRAGDRLIAIDDEDVSYLTAVKISKILNRKSNQVTRKLTVLRAMGVA